MNGIWKERTGRGSLNYIGAVYRYFDSYTADASAETKVTYMQRYQDHIFPHVDPDVPISAYDETRINSLFKLIKERSGLSSVSIQSDLRHLVYSPCFSYFDDEMNEVPYREAFWGLSDRFRHKNEDVNSLELNIRKSLTVEEQKLAAKILLNPERDNGEYVGLALMFFMGVRNNEACALKFGDVKEMHDHIGCHFMQVYETVRIKSNVLKAGGKTRNAPRRIPIMAVLYDFLEKRKAHICRQLEFPYTDENGNVYSSVDEFPIACRGNRYTQRCSSDDLTKAGRTFLRHELNMKEQAVSGVSYYIELTENTWEDIDERDATTYLLRRNMATQIYVLGFEWDEIQYYMGHAIESANLIRSDYTDEEFLYHLWVLLNKHPLNCLQAGKNGVQVEIGAGETALVRITAKEMDDSIMLAKDSDASLDIKSLREYSMRRSPSIGVDITKHLHRRYRL